MTTNAELFARRQAAIVRGVGNASPISAARALNSEIWDVEGKRYVDFAGGIAVVNTGHCTRASWRRSASSSTASPIRVSRW